MAEEEEGGETEEEEVEIGYGWGEGENEEGFNLWIADNNHDFDIDFLRYWENYDAEWGLILNGDIFDTLCRWDYNNYSWSYSRVDHIYVYGTMMENKCGLYLSY